MVVGMDSAGETAQVMIGDASRMVGRAQRLWARAPVSLEHRRVLTATALIGVFTVGVKLVALVRDTVVASRLGTSDANDAYITAWLIPGFASTLVANALVAALLPVFVEARAKRGPDAARRAYAEVMLISFVVLGGLMIGVYLGGSWLLRQIVPDYGPEKMLLTNQLMRIMLPALALSGLVTIWSGMLNVEERFGFAAAAPAVVPLATGLVFFLIPSAGAHVLAAAFVAGTGIQCALLFLELRRRGIGVPVGWHGGLAETRQIARQFGPLLANGAVFGGLGVVDQTMAASLGSGNASMLSYGTRLVMPFLAISSTALGTAIFPHFSRLVASEDWDGLRATLRTYSGLILALTVPLSLAIIASSEPVVRLLFQRGAFTAADARQVAHVQAIYAVVIPIECLAVLLSRLVVSLRSNAIMFYGSVGLFTVNIAGDVLLKRFFGVDGIVIATVLTQAASLAFLVIVLRRLLGSRGRNQ
jgi:putative peptidoglycan lipid II flippase